jgi:cell division inhibitor SepF
MGLANRIKNFVFHTAYNEDDFEDEIIEETGGYDGEWHDDGITHIDSRHFGRRTDARQDRRNDTIALTPKKTVNKIEKDSVVASANKDGFIIVASPDSINSAASTSNHLKEGKTVVVKVDAIDAKEGQRIMDFLSGVVHCLDGQVHEISNRIYILAPKNIEVSDHFKENLKANGIFSSFKASFGR